MEHIAPLDTLNISKNSSRNFSKINAIYANCYIRCALAGLLMPLGFAPFHWPVLSILGVALFFLQLNQNNPLKAFKLGMIFGCSYFGLGVSWVYVSIHSYGHIHPIFSVGITLLFISYLSLFTGLLAIVYSIFNKYLFLNIYQIKVNQTTLLQGLLFSALWTICEMLRGIVFTGFPWLILGLSQIDTPLKNAFSIIGIEGVSFISAFIATLLVAILTQKKQWILMLLFVSIFFIPWGLLTNINQSSDQLNPNKPDKALKVSVIQANLSMREKWDESLFNQLIMHYDTAILKLLPRSDLIVLPESAIPLPNIYVTDLLKQWHKIAKIKHNAIVLGIPEIKTHQETEYYNTIETLGNSSGTYQKQHLVPFGEYIPHLFKHLTNKLNLPSLPMNDLTPGTPKQPLLVIHNHPIATLICYELAYPNLLRQQMPQAEWIISISDDGWFGHSFAMYQQLQMAQALAILTQRFHIIANNDGLSSIINPAGDIIASVPAFKAGTITAKIYPQTKSTIWSQYGDTPILILCLFLLFFAFIKLLNVVVFSRFGYSKRLGRNY